MINHKDNKQVWLLGIINNSTKEFRIRIEVSFSREGQTLSKFIKLYVETGNTIISDGWYGYNFLNSESSGYHHITHVHMNGIFGQGIQSSSHIEAIWNIIKSKIKSIYQVIPHKNFMQFFGEAEYRYKIRNKSSVDKIKDFFECYRLIDNLADVEFSDSGFINASDDDIEEEFED